MRGTTTLFLFALALFAFGQSDTYGKTEAQILAMGEDKWDAFYMAKAGNSEASMTQMTAIFGDAALHRNDRLAKHVAPRIRARVLKLRETLEQFGDAAVDLGSNIDGGGTMWHSVSAGVEVHTEMVLYAQLGGRPAKAKHTTLSAANHALDDLSGLVAKTHADKDASAYFKYDRAKQSLTQMRITLAQIALTAKRLDRETSDRLLGFCIEYARLARADWG